MLQRLASRWTRGPRAVSLTFLFGLCSMVCACSGGSTNSEKPECELDTDCGAAAPHCTDSGTCVGCEDDSQCGAAAPVCEQVTHTCQVCRADSECASGVCLEAQGTCAAPDQLIYVKEAGGMDNSECDEKSPCKTVSYASNRVTATRNVIRVIGNLTSAAELQNKVVVDGDGSTWTATPANIVVSVATANSDVTIEGFTLQGAAAFQVVDCFNMGTLRIHQTTIQGGEQKGVTSVCKLTITNSKLLGNVGGGVMCTDNGALTIEDSELLDNTQKTIEANTCSVRLARNRISANPGPQFMVELINPPKLEVENNLIWDKLALTSSGLSVTNGPTDGYVRFNTVVNTTTGAHPGEGIRCTGTSVVSSNVIAWQHGQAVVGNACARRYNAFDSSTEGTAGEGNVSASMPALFVDPAADFHLAAGSPAHGLAEPGLSVAQDLEGKARAAATRLDAGAFETP